MQSKKAVVLHGPMGVGKSTVADIICSRAQAGNKIVLDHGWHSDGIRYRGGVGRYEDLSRHTDPVIVVEIACGGPLDLAFPGATTGADEWIKVLRSAGRDVSIFRLWADWPTVRKQMSSRSKNELLLARLWHNAFEAHCDIVSFPPTITEIEVNVRDATPETIATRIMRLAGI